MNSTDTSNNFGALSVQFVQYHQDPTNVFLHFVTTPVGLIGALSLLHRASNSSSAALFLVSIYLLSLLPTVPNGIFVGTLFLSILIIYTTRQLKLNIPGALAFMAVSYLIQDLSHLGTGEETFQSTYSAGGHVSHTPNFILALCAHEKFC